MIIIKWFNRLICMAIGCLVIVCFVNAQQQYDDSKYKGSVRTLLWTFDQNGEKAAIDQARMRGFRIRQKAGEETLLPLILETKPGISTHAFDRAWCENRGIKVEAVSSSFIRVLVPFRLARQLALHPQIAVIREPRKPVPFQIGMGSPVSESVALTGASILQGQNITGSGIKIAVIDLGFIGLGAAVTAGDIPPGRVIVDLVDSNNDIETVTDHGTSVAEQVMDMAPGATLYCIQISDELDFQNAARYLAANNIHIANHSMGWINGSYYNDKGFIDSIVNASHDIDNVFWTVAAGNEAARHWRGTWTDANNNNMLEFSGADEYMDISPSTVATSQVFLNWNQYDAVKTDLDLYIYDKNNLIVDSSTYRQPPEYPCESVQFSYQTSREPYKIAVKWHSGPKTNLDITIFCPTNDIEYKTPGYSIVEPGCAHGAFTVAAVDQLNWRLVPPIIESISSQGPTVDGRMKPDITAPDYTSSFTTGDSAAYGTSFASPVVAGAAALLRQEYPSLSVTALADTLRALAKDVGKTGIDSVFGSGLLYLCLPAPVLVSPANGAAIVPLNPALTWDTVDNAATYRIQLSTSSGFGTTIIDDSTPTTYVTSRTAGTLSNSTTYYWRVRSKNGRGVSAWSATWSFTTLPAVPSVPSLASPSNGTSAVSLTPSLSWNTANGAATYRVQLSTSAAFSSTLIDDSTVTAPSTSKAAGTLSTATTYYWRVNAKNAGGTSGWSATWSFVTVPAAPAAPALSSPSNSAASVSLTPALSWNAANGAVTYRVQLSTNSSFTTTLIDDSTLAVTSKAAGTLSTATTYYWRVNAKNAGGTSGWSAIWSFTTIPSAPSAPALLSPSNGAGSIVLTPSLLWNASGGAVTYRVQLSTSASFSTTIVDDSTVAATFKAAPTLSNNITYYWRVNAKNAGGTSPWSAIWSFTTVVATPAIPVLSSPANAATDIALTPTLSWNAASGANTYRMQLSTGPSFTTTVVDDSTLSTTSKPAGTLVNSTTYYWRTNAKNAGGTSAWSTTWSFTTIIAAPTAPSLSSPVNGAANQPLTTTLAWSSVTGASSYHLQVSTSAAFSTIFFQDSTLASATDAVSGLDNSGTYYWRVRAKNAGGTSAWSTSWNFVTIPPAAGTPVLSSPANAATDIAVNPSLVWNTVGGALSYRIQLSVSSSFSTTIIDDSTVTAPAVTKSTGTLANNTTYYWRVNAKNAGGTSAWSATWSFTTLPVAPSAPLLSSPVNAGTDIALSPTLSWNVASGAVTYHVQLSTVSSFITTVVDDSTATATSKVAGPLVNNTGYYWRVCAKNSGGTSAWSSTWSFTTIVAAPGTTILSSPANGAVGLALNPTLTWNTAAGATTYRVQLSTSAVFTATIVDDSTVAGTTKAISSLLKNAAYYWRVCSKNAAGTSAWSATWSFSTLPAAPSVPALSFPADAATGISLLPTLSWNAATGADTYRVQLSVSSSFATTLVDDSTLTASVTSKAVPTLANSTVYYWRVYAKNSGGTSAWSSTWSFTTIVAAPAVPALSSPANAAADLAPNPTLLWNTAAGAATYHVQLSTSAAFTSTVIDDSTLTAASKATGPLLSSTTYYWRVNAKNAGGTSAWSATWNFTTIIDTPLVPALSFPANASTDIVLTPTLSWNTANGAVTYRVQLSTVSTFAATIFDDSTLATTSTTSAALANSTTYYWRVNAKNAGGTSPWSSTWSFVTKPPAPSVPVLALPANGAASISLTPALSWNAATGAVTYRVQLSTGLSFSTTLINDSTLTAVSRATGTLSNGTTYYWRVNAKNTGGTSAWSTVWSFATLPAIPVAVTVLLPAAAAIITVDSAVFTWQKSQPAIDSYAQEIAHDSLMANKVYNDTLLTDTVRARKGFANGVYWWRVKAHNASGWGNYSAVRKFIIAIPTTAVIPINYEMRLSGVMSAHSEIRYAIPVSSKVSIMIYTIQGRRVETLCDTYQHAGYYAVKVNLKTLSKGYYLIDFRAGNCILKKNLLVY